MSPRGLRAATGLGRQHTSLQQPVHNQWGANVGAGFFFGATSNSICTGVDERGDAQKIVYITPNFSGFQLTVSYTPSGGDETHVDGVGPHTGMPVCGFGESRHNTSAYATYSYEGESWGLTAGLGGSFEGHVEQGNFFSPASFDEQDFYQAGINLTFGNFAIGVAGEYYNDLFGRDVVDLGENDTNSWVFGVGAAYTTDAWVFGAQYSHREDDIDVNDGVAYPSEDIDDTQNRAVLTAIHALGPGIQVDGELGYTWTDADPDDFVNPSVPDGAFDYDGFEFGIGTNINLLDARIAGVVPYGAATGRFGRVIGPVTAKATYQWSAELRLVARKGLEIPIRIGERGYFFQPLIG